MNKNIRRHIILKVSKSITLRKIRGLKIFNGVSGSLTTISIIAILVFSILFISIFDIFQLYIAREHTKNASDAIALAAVQNLLFFEDSKIIEIAEETGKENGCSIDSIEFNYDEITVTTVTKADFLFLGKILKNSSLIYSTSRVKVIYPWDEKFGSCKSYRFDY